MATLAKEVTSESLGSITVTDKVNVLVDQTKYKTHLSKKAANDNNFNDLFEICEAPQVKESSDRKSKREIEVEKTVTLCNQLVEKHRKYNDDYIVRGNQALYELLSDVYKAALALEKSDYKYEIHKKLRDVLKTQGIKVQSNTPDLTLLVKYVVGSDRKRATNYSRILKIALLEGLAPEELANYISRRGGIGQIHDVEADSIAKQMGQKVTKERLDLMKEYLILSQWASDKPVEFQFDQDIMRHNMQKQTRSETATFAVFLADYDEKKDVYRVISGHDLGRTYEDCLLRFIIKNATGDVSKIKAGIVNLKKRLVAEKRVHPNYAKALEEQIKKSS